MTWIVGTPITFGYALLIGDIRVTTSDGKLFDGVRKVAGICENLAGGFAGNIYQGFTILEHVTGLSKLGLSKVPKGHSWIPERLIEICTPEMRRIYADTAKIIGEKNAGVDIMLVGIHPTENVPHNTPWPLPYCYIFRSPFFIPEIVPVGKVASIGSGSGVESYVSELENLSDFKRAGQLMQMEVGNPGGFGQIISHIIGGVAGRQHATDVSPHLISCLIKRGDMTEWKNDRTTFIGDQQKNFTMPRIANSFEELLEIAEGIGINSEHAKALIA